MLTIALTFCFFGFYFFYSTSRRAVLQPKNTLQQWVELHEYSAKYLGAAALLCSLILCIIDLGIASGICSYIISLMTIASCIIIAGPLRILRPVFLLVLTVFFLILELYITSYAG